MSTDSRTTNWSGISGSEASLGLEPQALANAQHVTPPQIADGVPSPRVLIS